MDGLLVTAMLLWGRQRGLSREDLGLGADSLRRGAALLGIAIVAGLGVCVLVFAMTRDASSAAEVLSRTGGDVLRIFAITATMEEIIFRGAFLGIAIPALGRRRAILVQSVSFGLWHIGPSIAELGLDETADIVGVLGRVAFTGVAAVALALVRVRYRSVVPCVALHGVITSVNTVVSGIRVT